MHERVITVKLEIEGVMMNVVTGYALQVDCVMEEKEKIWSELNEVVESTFREERVMSGADFNGHIVEGNRSHEEVNGRFPVK